MGDKARNLWWLSIFILFFCTSCSYLPNNNKSINFQDVKQPPSITAGRNQDDQALRVAVSSVLLPQETILHYRSIANFLGRQVNRPVILIQRKSYAEIALLLMNGGADIAFFSSGGYANYSGVDDIEMLVSQQRAGLPFYQGYLLVGKDSGIDDIGDLKGKTIAFTDPLSFSGYTFLVQLLRQMKQTPESFFGRYIYTYSHDNSFRAIANNVVDAAPVSRVVYDRAKEKQPELVRAVKIIAVSPQAGIGPIVAGKSLNKKQREILRQALLSMHETSFMRPALAGLSIDCFVAPEPELFEPIRQMINEKRTLP